MKKSKTPIKLIFITSLVISVFFLLWLICFFWLLQQLFQKRLWIPFSIFVFSLLVLPCSTLVIRIHLKLYFDNLRDDLLQQKKTVLNTIVYEKRDKTKANTADIKKKPLKSIISGKTKLLKTQKSSSLKEKKS